MSVQVFYCEIDKTTGLSVEYMLQICLSLLVLASHGVKISLVALTFSLDENKVGKGRKLTVGSLIRNYIHESLFQVHYHKNSSVILRSGAKRMQMKKEEVRLPSFLQDLPKSK